jgi:hypothetical protein
MNRQGAGKPPGRREANRRGAVRKPPRRREGFFTAKPPLTPRIFPLGKFLGVVVALVGCHSHFDSCTDDLAGEYVAGDLHWMIIDHTKSLEIYPLFPDVPRSEFEVAPRVIELTRTEGFVNRRFMKGSHHCNVQAAAHLTACHGDELEIVMADPGPPTDFEKCTSIAGTSKREIWRRMR